MADSNADELIRLTDRVFSKKLGLDSLWQRLAEEFYPERADFTRVRSEGEEFAENLFESTPAQNRRELAYAMGSLMRPPAKKWFKMKPRDAKLRTDQAMMWLGNANDEMRSLIYSGKSRWQASLQEGDNDVIAFGNAVHSMTEGPARDRSIIYETHHLRDCAWQEDRTRAVNWLARKFKLALRNWEATFPGVPMDEKHVRIREKDPFHEVDITHVAMASDKYDPMSAKLKKANKPFMSVYICPESRKIVREGGYMEFPYLVRRWNLRHGSPYGYSPASMIGLIDARVLQAQSRVILDAGEFSARPPMLARDEVIGEAQIYAGAVNYISSEYDERLGDAIRPIEMGQNLGIGLEMKQDTRQLLAAAFFLNKLTLPSDKDMTAYEVGERISEYIRSIGPVVEPFEQDNTGLLDATFQMGLRLRRFGGPQELPRELVDADLGYDFDTPIQIAYERQKFMRARETVTMLGETVQATGRQDILDNYDLDKIARSAGRAIDGDADWIVPIEQVMAERAKRVEMAAQTAQRQAAAETVGNLQGMADVANTGIDAAQKVGMLPAPEGVGPMVDGVPYLDVTDQGYPEAVGWPEAPAEEVLIDA